MIVRIFMVMRAILSFAKPQKQLGCLIPSQTNSIPMPALPQNFANGPYRIQLKNRVLRGSRSQHHYSDPGEERR